MSVSANQRERDVGMVMADDTHIEISVGGQVSLTPVIRLWPDGPPSRVPCVGSEITFASPATFGPETDMLRNVSDPSLTVFMPDPAKANGVGVVVCPGGAWRVLAWEHEGTAPARWLAARGYTHGLPAEIPVLGLPPDPVEFAAAANRMAASRSFPIPAAEAPRALADAIHDESIARAREIAADDGRRAIEIVRGRAAEWSLEPDRIGMIGFSAGVFLTTDVALDPRAAPLGFVAPIYGGETQGRAVPADAPPLFTAVAQDDRMFFRVVEGLYADWSSADRPAELHIFTRGGHGFGVGKRGLPVIAGSICWGTGWRIKSGAPSRILPGSYWRGTAPFERSRNSSGDKLSECRRLVASPHADMSLARTKLRIHLTNVQRAKMSWLSRISWLGSGLRPRKRGRGA
jgi:dienelactone hydrolase